MSNILGYRHTTRDGKVIHIASMETRHLLNMIRYGMRQCNKLFVLSQNQVGAYKAELYDLDHLSPEEAAEQINSALELLVPYILEAFFRSDEIAKPEYAEVMKQIKEYMVSFMQRSGRADFNVDLTNLLPKPRVTSFQQEERPYEEANRPLDAGDLGLFMDPGLDDPWGLD